MDRYEKQAVKLSEKTFSSSLSLVQDANDFVWTRLDKIVQYRSDHGTGHSARLIKWILEILSHKNSRLNPVEWYVLLVSVYLHDIGYQADIKKNPRIKKLSENFGAKFSDRFEDNDIYTPGQQGEIDTNHAFLSCGWIEYSREIREEGSNRLTLLELACRNIPNELVRNIETIVLCHKRNDFDICDNDFIYGTEIVRIPLLAALLRLADEMHISCRVDKDVSVYREFPPEEFFVLYLRSCTELTFKNNEMRFYITVNDTDFKDYAAKIGDLIKTHFFKEVASSIKELWKHDIHIASHAEIVLKKAPGDKFEPPFKNMIDLRSPIKLPADVTFARLREEAKTWLLIMSGLEPKFIHNDNQSFMMVAGHSGTDKVLIYGLRDPAEVGQVRDTVVEMNSQSSQKALLVTMQNVTEEAKTQASEHIGLEIAAFEELSAEDKSGLASLSRLFGLCLQGQDSAVKLVNDIRLHPTAMSLQPITVEALKIEAPADRLLYLASFVTHVIQSVRANKTLIVTQQLVLKAVIDLACDTVESQLSKQGQLVDAVNSGISQVCFDVIALLALHLNTEKFKSHSTILLDIWQHAVDWLSSTPPLVRQNAAWIARLSFNPGNIKTIKEAQNILGKFPNNGFDTTREETNVCFEMLLFFIKSLVDQEESIGIVSNRIRAFSELHPLSGFSLYAYLEHGGYDLGTILEPLLTCSDDEPREQTGHCHYSVVQRALATIGAFGTTEDARRITENWLLNFEHIDKTADNSLELGELERVAWFAIQEILFCPGVATPNRSSTVVTALTLRQVFSEKLEHIFDEQTGSFSIYADSYKYIRDYKEETGTDSVKNIDPRLCQKAGTILGLVSQQYFRDKLSLQRSRGPTTSLLQLNEELGAINRPNRPGFDNSRHKIKSEHVSLWFEPTTVGEMIKITLRHVENEPDDLINLTNIAFKKWHDNGWLGKSDTPVFASWVNNKSDSGTATTHVVNCNKEILEMIKQYNWDDGFHNSDCLQILDIGAGIGNTADAVIHNYHQNMKRHIVSVELHEGFADDYARRQFVIFSGNRLLGEVTTPNPENYEIDHFTGDIRRFLRILNENDGWVDAYEWLKGGDKPWWFDFTKSFERSGALVADFKNYLLNIAQPDVKSKIEKFEEKLNEESKEKVDEKFLQECFKKFQDKVFHAYSLEKRSGQEKKGPRLFGDGLHLIMANYVLHHLPPQYRQEIYTSLLRLSRDGALLAIADPFPGTSDINRSSINFLNEGVFSCFNTPQGSIEEMNGLVVDGYTWEFKEQKKEPDETGFFTIFQKKRC